MQFNTVRQIHFSPSGTTRLTAETLSRHCPGPVLTYDLLRHPPVDDISCDPDDLAVVALPVHSGRLPSVCLPALSRFTGQGTPALAVVVYGNRAYEDALLELQDCLTNAGFIVMGAAAIVARHSIFPQVAAGRPHEEDQRRMEDFVRRCLEKRLSKAPVTPLNLPGSRPYGTPRPRPSSLPLMLHAFCAVNACAFAPQEPLRWMAQPCANNRICASHVRPASRRARTGPRPSGGRTMSSSARSSQPTSARRGNPSFLYKEALSKGGFGAAAPNPAWRARALPLHPAGGMMPPRPPL